MSRIAKGCFLLFYIGLTLMDIVFSLMGLFSHMSGEFKDPWNGKVYTQTTAGTIYCVLGIIAYWPLIFINFYLAAAKPSQSSFRLAILALVLNVIGALFVYLSIFLSNTFCNTNCNNEMSFFVLATIHGFVLLIQLGMVYYLRIPKEYLIN